MTAGAPLCPGGRCAQVLTGVAQWRGEFARGQAERLGHRMAEVFRGSLDDAELSWEVRRRLEDAFTARMERFAEGLTDERAA